MTTVYQVKMAIAAAEQLSEGVKNHVTASKEEIRQRRGSIISPISGGVTAKDAEALLVQIQGHMKSAQDASQALVKRLERAANDAAAI